MSIPRMRSTGQVGRLQPKQMAADSMYPSGVHGEVSAFTQLNVAGQRLVFGMLRFLSSLDRSPLTWRTLVISGSISMLFDVCIPTPVSQMHRISRVWDHLANNVHCFKTEEVDFVVRHK
mmetsp:Transcript_3174/g.19592  ORF Transcript_3174/g.19592 Transcript_3174/m.19592 type:complete len:119 (-) Transcript_3174:319-675(-)